MFSEYESSIEKALCGFIFGLTPSSINDNVESHIKELVSKISSRQYLAIATYVSKDDTDSLTAILDDLGISYEGYPQETSTLEEIYSLSDLAGCDRDVVRESLHISMGFEEIEKNLASIAVNLDRLSPDEVQRVMKSTLDLMYSIKINMDKRDIIIDSKDES